MRLCPHRALQANDFALAANPSLLQISPLLLIAGDEAAMLRSHAHRTHFDRVTRYHADWRFGACTAEDRRSVEMGGQAGRDSLFGPTRTAGFGQNGFANSNVFSAGSGCTREPASKFFIGDRGSVSKHFGDGTVAGNHPPREHGNLQRQSLAGLTLRPYAALRSRRAAAGKWLDCTQRQCERCYARSAYGSCERHRERRIGRFAKRTGNVLRSTNVDSLADPKALAGSYSSSHGIGDSIAERNPRGWAWLPHLEN